MRQLNPRALEYLHALSRHGGLRKAAARLNVDPATVSRLLSQLEQAIGLPVWERSGNQNLITAAGQELLVYYRQMRANEAAALSRIHDLRELQRGKVSIAIGEGFITDLISNSLQSFLAAYPGIRLNIEMAGARDAVRLLEEEQIDFAVAYASAPHPRLQSLVETLHPLDLIVPPDHPLALRGSPVSLSDIIDYPLALIDGSTGMGRLVNLAQETNHLRLEPHLQTNSVSVLKSFVASGIGITFMPALTVSAEIEAGSIKALPMTDAVLANARARVIRVAERPMTLPAQALLDHLKAHTLFLNSDVPPHLR